MIGTQLQDANLSNCRIFGISAWNVNLEGATQSNLIITDYDEPEITVDNLEIAQFIYLLLHNEKLRDVIDTIGKKAVLILGRFTDERKAVLEAIREELRRRDYIPILFDFEKPVSRTLTETILTLAHLCALRDRRSHRCQVVSRYELGDIVPQLRSVAVQPIILKGNQRHTPCFKHFQAIADCAADPRIRLPSSIDRRPRRQGDRPRRSQSPRTPPAYLLAPPSRISPLPACAERRFAEGLRGSPFSPSPRVERGLGGEVS